jgi:hypothetical protein
MSTERIVLPLANLGCGGGGSLRLEQAILRVEGVSGAVVNPATEMAYIEYDPQRVQRAAFDTLIAAEGFGGDNAAATAAAPVVTAGGGRGLPPDTVGLVTVIWMCSLPLIALLVVPLLGIRAGAGLSVALLGAGLLFCWLHHRRRAAGPSEGRQPVISGASAKAPRVPFIGFDRSRPSRARAPRQIREISS